MSDFNHAENIYLIVHALSNHQPGDYGDCSINHPVMTIIDERRPAHELLAALRLMDAATAAGIAAQLSA
jgi:hypothetical protein